MSDEIFSAHGVSIEACRIISRGGADIADRSCIIAAPVMNATDFEKLVKLRNEMVAARQAARFFRACMMASSLTRDK